MNLGPTPREHNYQCFQQQAPWVNLRQAGAFARRRRLNQLDESEHRDVSGSFVDREIASVLPICNLAARDGRVRSFARAVSSVWLGPK
jgi:hypothetical protein